MAIGSLANFVKSKLNETNLSETFGTLPTKKKGQRNIRRESKYVLL